MKRPPLFALVLLALACPALSSAPEPKADGHALFRDGDRVCLIGDSITHSGTFHSHIFLYYATRFPERRVTFMNCGISGDSASGMQRRLEWDVFARRPSVLTLSAGMNDVGRSLYSASKPVENASEKKKESIERFKENIRQLAASFRERGLRTIFITPTPYEEDPDLPTENLRGVNAALGQCSDFVLDLAKSQNAVAVDFWHPLNAISEKGKKADPAFTLTRKDRVHPEAAAHLVMAYLFLDQTGAPSDVWRLSIDATKSTVVSQNNCEAGELECKEHRVTFSNRELALPWPFIEEAKEAYALAPITERLNQQILQISGLGAGRYDLAINDAVVGTYSHDEMQQGVNLADNARTPQNGTGRELAALCAEHHSLGSKLRTLRRVEIKHLAKVDLGDRAAVKAALEKFIAEKEAAKKDPEANSGYYIKTARTYLEEIGNEATIKERMAAIEDEIYRVNRPRSYAYTLVKADSNDMNSWAGVTTGTTLTRNGGIWSIFAASFDPFANAQREGGVLKFGGLLGKAEVWIDGKLAATKSEFENASLLAPFPPGSGIRSVRVLFESEGEKPVGFSAPVSVAPAVPTAFNAQGEIVGEVTANRALLQSRLTTIPGPELDAAGDIPGIAGKARFEWSEDEKFAKSQLTSSIEAKADSDFILRARLTDLQPGTRYFYRLIFEDGRKGATRSFKTLDPEAKSVSFTIGSCMNYLAFTTGISNGGGPVTASEEDKQLGYPSFAAMQTLNPDFFIGAGDVVYYSFPLEAPAKTLPAMRKKWHEQFRFPRMAEFFAKTPTYWLKDDHDFRFDDADQSGDKPPLASTGISLFREQMPIHPAGDQSAPNYRTHRISKDVQLWFLEGRDHRSDNKSPDGPDKSLWGAEQRQWLERTLAASDAKWKILISPTPMVGPDRASKSDNHTNPAGFRAEADSFFEWLKKKDIKNVLILCGDRHWQYHSIHPTGVEEFSVGALNDENSIVGIKPGDPKSTDPEGEIKQPFLYDEPSGGFVQVTANPDSTLRIAFFDDTGRPVHLVDKQPYR